VSGSIGDPALVAVVALAQNGVIGRDDGLVWRLRTDLQRFKAITLGKPLIMGRKTFQSIGRPLPGRATIVLTRDPAFAADGVEVAHAPEAAHDAGRRAALRLGAEEIVVAGGGEIYRLFLPLTGRIRATLVETEAEGDATFPWPLEPDAWRLVAEEAAAAGPHDDFPMRFLDFERRAPPPPAVAR
jgi:dihydrofolate reductase